MTHDEAVAAAREPPVRDQRDLVADVMLTRGEKIATLDRWRTMILEELAAANEGMHTRGATGLQTQVLDDIEKVRAELMGSEK